VFVVGCLGDWRSAAKVLFESESLCGNITPSRKEGKETSTWPAQCASTLNASFGSKLGLENQHINSGAPLFVADIAPTITSSGAGWSRPGNAPTEHETYVAFTTEQTPKASIDLAHTLTSSNHKHNQCVAYNITFCDANGTRKDRLDGGLYVNETDTSNTLTRAGVGTNVVQACDTYNGTIQGDVTATITTKGGGVASGPSVMQNMKVRRLTPMECERLQGFPDNYTNTPTSSDATRYKALGNSMAVPVMKWIGERIKKVNNEQTAKTKIL
jgi:DNA (cytosine-5)-methyltransferase 1